MIDQLTVSLPDEPGMLAGMCRLLGKCEVQIHALMVAETVDFGIVRIICDKPCATAAMLRDNGYNAMTSQVVAVEVNNVPGALGNVLDRLASCDLNVEYAYSCSLDNKTVDVVKVTGEPLQVKLGDCGLKLLSPDEVYVVDEE